MKPKWAVMGVVCALGLIAFDRGAQAGLLTYDLDFAGSGGVAGSGQITVDTALGIATAGSFQLTSGPFTTGPFSLYTWSGGGVSSVRVDGGTDLIVDNQVNPGSNPFLDPLVDG